MIYTCVWRIKYERKVILSLDYQIDRKIIQVDLLNVRGTS